MTLPPIVRARARAPTLASDMYVLGTELVWAGDLRTPFDPSLVAVARSTGQLYYPSPLSAFKSELALIRPSVTTSLMSLLDIDEETGRQTLTWNGRRHLLPDV